MCGSPYVRERFVDRLIFKIDNLESATNLCCWIGRRVDIEETNRFCMDNADGDRSDMCGRAIAFVAILDEGGIQRLAGY